MGGRRPVDMESASQRDATDDLSGGGPRDTAPSQGGAGGAPLADANRTEVPDAAPRDLAPDVPVVPMPSGTPCTTREQCSSNLCIDGVCCNSLCPGTCNSCNVPGLEGLCVPVPFGRDPDNECADTAAASCGTSGACDGAGKCSFHDAAVVCGARACVDGVESMPRRCDGKGSCRIARLKTCAPYGCDGDHCATTCVPGSSCGVRGACLATGKCPGLLALGEPCTKGGDCTSGSCASGVCCDGGCSARGCYACNVPDYVGICSPAVKGTDPTNTCAREDAATCGRTGACDGIGGCELYNPGTVCLGGLCAAGVEVSPRLCNGQNTCRAPLRMRTCRDGCGERTCRICPATGCEDAGVPVDMSAGGSVDMTTTDGPAGN